MPGSTISMSVSLLTLIFLTDPVTFCAWGQGTRVMCVCLPSMSRCEALFADMNLKEGQVRKEPSCQCHIPHGLEVISCPGPYSVIGLN